MPPCGGLPDAARYAGGSSLQNKIKFLSEIGYEITNNNESIDCKKNGVVISIFNQHFSDHAGVLIRYVELNGEKCNEIFYLDWFVYYFNNCNFIEFNGEMESLLESIDLLKRQLNEFTDIHWCRNVLNVVRKSLDRKFP